MFVLCFCYVISSIPHTIFAYWGPQYDKQGDQIFRISLGVFWLQYAFNVWIYVAQRDQYWNAYKDYIFEKLLPWKIHQLKSENNENNKNKFDSSSCNEPNSLKIDKQVSYQNNVIIMT